MHNLRLLAAASLLAPFCASATPATITTIGVGFEGEPYEASPIGLTLSPDGQSLTFGSTASNVNAPGVTPNTSWPNLHWLLDVETGEHRELGTPHRFTRSGGAYGGGARISHNGRYAVFAVEFPQDYDPAVTATDSGELLVRLDLATDTYVAFPKRLDGNYAHGERFELTYKESTVAVSPDGRYAVFYRAGSGLTADQPSGGGGYFAWDFDTDQAVFLISGTDPMFFLADGRLIGSMGGPGGRMPAVWAIIGAPPAQYYDNEVDGVVEGMTVEHVTPDGRFLVVRETKSTGARTLHVDTQTGVWTRLCAHDIYSSGLCEVWDLSDDGRYLLAGAPVNLTDLERDQSIRAAADGWSNLRLANDGDAFYAVSPEMEIVKRQPHETRLETRVVAHAQEGVNDDDEEIVTVWFDVFVTNTGDRDATNVQVEIATDSWTDPDDVRRDFDNDLSPGEVWEGRVTWDEAPATRYDVTANWVAREQWIGEPSIKEATAFTTVAFDPPPPPPTPAPSPSDSGGGGMMGAWWLLLVPPALLRRRKMVGDTGIEPVTPAV